MILTSTLLLLAVSAQEPAFPAYSQNCEDDAGPRWTDDREHFGDGFYWSQSHARAVLNQDGTCAGPMESACQERANPLQAYLEGPISCPTGGWFCRIYPDPNHGVRGGLMADANFANCDVPSGNWEDTDHDQSGHCHGSVDPSVYYWWVRDHWHRPYSGRMKCCCEWPPRGVANRCDYRAKVARGFADECRDANEDHDGGRMGSGFLYGFEEGCPRNGDKVAYTMEPDDAMCWEVLNFGHPDDGDNDDSIYPTSTGPCTGEGSATGGSCDGTGVFSGPTAGKYTRPNGAGPSTPLTPSPTLVQTTTTRGPNVDLSGIDLSECTTAGSRNNINPEFGTIVLNGDSALDGNGDTEGNVERALSQSLNTYVINCAVGGATANDMYSQTACSNVDGCKFSVMTIGMNENEGRRTARQFVDRELNSGKKVIILGHPDPTNAGGSMPGYFQTFMNQYRSWANADSRITFMDTRISPWDQYNTWNYFADDRSHPSALMGTVMGNQLATTISGLDNSDSGNDNSGNGNDNNDNESGDTILVIGDSWMGPEFEQGTLDANCAGKNVNNIAQSGSTAQEWLSGDIRIGEAKGEPISSVYLTLGGNDLMGNGCRTSFFPTIRQRLNGIIAQIRADYGSSIPILMTGYGRGAGDGDGCGEAVLFGYNALIESIANENGASFVNIHHLFKNNPSDPFGNPQYFVDDIHLSVAGYNRMWSLPALQSAFGCGNYGNPITTTSRPSTTTRLPTTTTNSNSGSSFYGSETGSCPSGTSYVTDELTCERAAETRGLEYKNAITNRNRPRGCYRRGDRVWFNRATSFTTQNTMRTSICLCEGTSCNGASDDNDEDETSEDEEEISGEVQFFQSSQSCSGGSHITDEEICEIAAEELGLNLRRVIHTNRRVRGCYSKGNKVFFNENTSQSTPRGGRQSICMRTQRRLLSEN